MSFITLKALINDTFTIEKVFPPTYKMWDVKQGKMLTSPTWVKGYRKTYGVDTNKGKLDLGSGQIGTLLESVFDDGRADLNGVTFKVKSNGKQGMEVRYFFDVVNDEDQASYIEEPMPQEEDIPFFD